MSVKISVIGISVVRISVLKISAAEDDSPLISVRSLECSAPPASLKPPPHRHDLDLNCADLKDGER